jgi:hypothetical protein
VQFYESRYFAPLAAIPAALVPFGLIGRHRVLAVALVLPLAVVTSLQLTEVRTVARAHEDDTRTLHTAAAQWTATHLPADAVVAVEGAGAQRWFAPRTMTIVDLVGLNDRAAARLHHDRHAKLCHFVRRAPTHMVMPADWVRLFSDTFALRPLTAFDDPSYTQVAPPRPLRVLVLAVDGVRPPWNERCADPGDSPAP